MVPFSIPISLFSEGGLSFWCKIVDTFSISISLFSEGAGGEGGWGRTISSSSSSSSSIGIFISIIIIITIVIIITFFEGRRGAIIIIPIFSIVENNGSIFRFESSLLSGASRLLDEWQLAS